MRGDRNVQLYVDAKRDLDSLRRQSIADPTRLKSDVFMKFLNDATVAVDTMYRSLTGSQLGRARRILATPLDDTTNQQGD